MGFAKDKSMKRRLILASMVFAAWISTGITIALSQSSSSRSTVVFKESQKRKLQLGLIGYLPLPEGYKAYRTKDLRDAWYGYIISPDNIHRITWASGMVQTPFEDGQNKFLCVKREAISKGVLEYGLMRTDSGEKIAATVGHVNLYMTVKAEKDIDLFLSIVRSYRVEKCDDCERPLPEPPSSNGMHRTRN
jgi:hypothetical protein